MRKIITLAAVLVALAPSAILAQTDGAYDRSYVRMSYVQGDVYVQRSGDLGYQAGEVNLVVIAGDKIGTRAGRLELQLGRQNYLRLDNDTVVEMAALPAADAQPTKIHLLSGNIFVRINSLGGARDFEIHSPDASFYILAEGLYRLDVREGRETALRVIEGEAEASGEQGSIVAKSGESLVAAEGRFVADANGLTASSDDFRSWNDSRDALFSRPVEQSYLPAEYSEYESELADNGSWTYEPDYGNVWVPRVAYDDWRPYSYGHWAWYPIIGWTWVSSESWGWCTSHYGRWGWGDGLGWYWIPQHHWGWGPAWVHWYWDSDYIGWSPLSYWGYPCHLVGNRFYDRYMDRGFPRDSRSLMMVHRNQLQNRNLRNDLLGRDSLARVGRDNLRNGQPDLKPNVARSGEIANRARGALSGNSVRGVTRSFSPGTSRLVPETLRQNVIRKTEGSLGYRGREIGTLGGENSGSRIVRKDGGADNGARSPSGSTGTARQLREFPTRRSPESGSSGSVNRTGGSTARTPETLRPRVGGNEGRTIRENPSRSTESRTLGSKTTGTVRTPSNSPATSSRTLRTPSGTTSFPSRTLGSTSRNSGNTGTSSSIRTPRNLGSSGSALRSRQSSGSAGSSSTSRSLGSPSRSSSSGSSSRSLSSPSRSSSSPSRSMSSPSRSSSSSRSPSGSSRSSGSVSRSSGGSSSRSSGSSSRSSGGSSRSSGSSGGGRIRK